MRVPNAAAVCFSIAIAFVATNVFGTEPIDYTTQIKPLFAEHCVSCHGSIQQKGGLRLDASQFLKTTGDSGGSITPSDPKASVLLDALKGTGGYSRMPKDADPLSDVQIALVERWIAEGAIAPQSEEADADPSEHWAYRPIERPAVPSAQPGSHVIDAFIAKRRSDATLVPIGPAARHVLLRRVYLDLVGVPPTVEELRSFLADSSPDAYERVVDQLLADPRHGERWGRHWMDVWRYSDWYGYGQELRNSQKHIWHWRDWIIESLNDGKPYDRMIVEMLAADEVAPLDDDALRATGFLARNYFKFNRDVWLDRDVEHTGKAFLGLTFNCARCHDHLFDPISQREYYAMRAVFEPHKLRMEPVDGITDENVAGIPRAYDAEPNTPTYLFIRGNDKQPDRDHPVEAVLPAFFVRDAESATEVKLPPAAFYPGLRTDVRERLLAGAQAALDEQAAAVAKFQAEVSAESSTASASPFMVAEAKRVAAEKTLEALRARISADDAKYVMLQAPNASELARIAANAERAAALASAEANLLVARRGLADAEAKPEAEREKAVAAAKKTLDEATKAVESAKSAAAMSGSESYSPLTAVYPSTSTGRRTLLANWIVDSGNPLTARVAVNHVWTRHFGAPLVDSMFDFGMHGSEPTHPELLDWLASEFIESGWDFKYLHRLIVTSEAYQLDSNSSSQLSNRNSQLDPDNHLYWRFNARRAEGEAIRDAMLAIAGRLDGRIGGPELDAESAQTTSRRSLYYRHAPEKYAPYLQSFDGASADECYRRAETVVPTQALAQVNSRLTREDSRLIARDLFKDAAATNAELVERAYECVLCRLATSAERAASLSFLEEQIARLQQTNALTPIETGPDIGVTPGDDPRLRAFASLVHVLLNHHDFVTIR